MTRDTLDRRTMLKTMAVGAATATIAGCSSGGGGSDGGESGGDSSGGDSGGDSSGTNSVDFGGWFEKVSNYDGVVDKTGNSEVTVKVGTEANGGGFGFGPAAVKVSKGTKVTWEWTGSGGSHNVVADGGEFESEMKAEKGYTFSHKFDSTGTYKYYCEPHKTMGMKGAIVVE